MRALLAANTARLLGFLHRGWSLAKLRVNNREWSSLLLKPTLGSFFIISLALMYLYTSSAIVHTDQNEYTNTIQKITVHSHTRGSFLYSALHLCCCLRSSSIISTDSPSLSSMSDSNRSYSMTIMKCFS